MPLSFDDPKPPPDTRLMQQISLRPSLKTRIDAERGRMSRSAWIERAIVAWFQRADAREAKGSDAATSD